MRFSSPSNLSGVLCILAGWMAALLLFMHWLTSSQWLKGRTTLNEVPDSRIQRDTSKMNPYKTQTAQLLVDNSSMAHVHNASRLMNLHQKVGVLEERLELLKNEPSQNFSRTCSTIKSDEACSSNCSKPLRHCPYKRLYDLFMSPKLTLSDAQRQTVLSIADSIPEADIIFLSAVSSNHYNEIQAMYYNLHTVIFPHITNYQAVLVDLGLSEKEREMTERKCQCKVIPYPVDKLPEHCGNNKCYAWKPLIVRALMEKAKKHLVYMDSSIRWRHVDKFKDVLKNTTARGVQLFRFDNSTRIPVHTLKQTFDYFGWEPCAFDGFPELQGNVGVYKRDAFVTQVILEPWARCAWEKSCICPVQPNKVIPCHGTATYYRCHRFDQSILGMLTARTFGIDMNKFIYRQDSYLGGNQNALDVKRKDIKPRYFAGS